MGKGGGSAPAQPTTQTVQQTNLPEYARPYFEELMQRGQAASQVAYQPYEGQRIAEFNPLQQQAFQGAANLGVSPLVQQGAGLTGLAAGQALGASQYQPMAPTQTYQAPQAQQLGLDYLTAQAPQLQQYQMGPAQRVGTGSFARPGAAEAYMSPYMQNVVDVQQREAQRQADIARTQRGAQAASLGAFGGSRQAIMEAEAARNLATQKGDIQAAGLQSAFQQAQQAYQTDAARRLQAQLANQQAGLTTGQQNLAALLQTQGLGAQTGLQAQQLNQAAQLQAQQQALGQQQNLNQLAQQNAQLQAQYGLAGLQAAEQSRQFGAGLGLQGAQTIGSLGGQLGQLGQTQFGQALGATQAQQQAGAVQQAQTQQGLDQAYEEFMRQQLYPQSQLQFYSSLLRGVPISPQQTMYTYQAAPSMASQIGGLAGGLFSGAKAFGAKKGGEVPGYAGGGITGGGEGQPTTPEVSKIKTALLKGADPRSMPPSIALLLAMSDPQVKKAMALRQGAKTQMALDQGRQQPQRTVLDEMLQAQDKQAAPAETVYAARGGLMDSGLGSLDTDMDYASGGIVAFERGGVPSAPAGIRYDPAEPSATPFGRMFEGIDMARRQNIEEEYLRRELMKRYGSKAGLGGLFTAQSDADREKAKAILDKASGLSLAELREFAANPEAAIPAAKGKPYTQAMMDADNPPQSAAPLAQPAARGPATGGSRTAIPAAQATATAGQSIKPETSLLYTGESPEAAFARKEAEMEKRFPSEMKERLAEIKEQAQQAVKDRDSDRWLAAANGFFAMAAGTSPYALKNFAEGAGVAVKDLMAVNKDYRKTQDLRNKAMREERKIDRLERMQKFDAADKARTRVEDITRQAQQADAVYKARLEELAIKRAGLDVEREKVKAYNRTPAEIQLVERVAKEKNIPFSEALALVAGTKREPMTRERAMTDYTKNALLLRDQYPTFDSYWRAMQADQGAAPVKTPKKPMSAFEKG